MPHRIRVLELKVFRILSTPRVRANVLHAYNVYDLYYFSRTNFVHASVEMLTGATYNNNNNNNSIVRVKRIEKQKKNVSSSRQNF